MPIDLNQKDLVALRDVLQEKVTDLDREINATDSYRYRDALRENEHQLERILGVVAAAIEPERAQPAGWEPRDNVVDTDSGKG
jgi:hypothetical protein